MLLHHLKNSCRFPQSNHLISALVARQPHVQDSNNKRNNNAFGQHTTQRHFSFAGLYAAISQSAPVLTLQTGLVTLHEWSGLPWWAVVVVSTLGLRSVMLPLAIHQNQVVARLSNMRDELKKLAPELNKEVNIAKRMYNWDEDTAKRVYRKQFRDLYNAAIVRENCHPFKTAILALVQIPVWVCFSIALRNLAFYSSSWITVPEPLRGLKTEGLMWFQDLTMPDPFVIPALLLVSNVVLTEMYSLRGVGKESRLQKILLNTSRVLILFVVVSATLNPSLVTFYWLCSSSFGVFQNILLMSPRFRKIVRIPTTPKDSLTPYKDIVSNFKNRCNKYFK